MEESILLTTLLDPLEKSIFHDSDDENFLECSNNDEEVILFEENDDDEKQFGLDESLKKSFVLDKENLNSRPRSSMKKRKKKRLGTTPLQSIENRILCDDSIQDSKRFSGSHSKVTSKFLELGSRIHSLLEESMSSSSIAEDDKPLVEKTDEGNENAEIVCIFDAAKKHVGKILTNFEVRIRNPVAETLSSDLKDIGMERYEDEENMTTCKPRIVVSEQEHSKPILRFEDQKDLFDSGRVGAFLRTLHQETEEEESNYNVVKTPQSSTTTMVLWNSSPELKFSPGNSTLQDHSLEQLKQKFLMRTERRRRRRKAIRKMLSIPESLDQSNVDISSPSPSPSKKDVIRLSSSSLPSCSIKATVVKEEDDDDDVEKSTTTKMSATTMNESIDEDDKLTKDKAMNDDNSWRDVIRKSVATMQKLDKIFDRRKEKEEEHQHHRVLPSNQSHQKTESSLETKETSSMSKTETYIGHYEGVLLPDGKTKSFVNIKKDKTPSQNKWWDRINESSLLCEGNDHHHPQVREMSSLDLVLCASSKQDFESKKKKKSIPSPSSSPESSIDMSSLMLSPEEEEESMKHILAPLPTKMTFRVPHLNTNDSGMLNTGTMEVIPLDIRSCSSSSLVRVELRITPRRDAPRALLEYLKFWNFSFAIEDETIMTSRSQPLTCQSDGSKDWFMSAKHVVRAETERVPMCRAVELHLHPKSLTRVRVSLTTSNFCHDMKKVPPVFCPALITIKARRLGSSSSSSSSVFRATVPLYLRNSNVSNPASLLLTNGNVLNSNDEIGTVKLRFAKHISDVLKCDDFSDESIKTIVSSSSIGTRTENIFVGEGESGRWYWQFVSMDTLGLKTTSKPVRFSAKIRASQSSRNSKCRWIIKSLSSESQGGMSLKADVTCSDFKFAIGFCAINSPVAIRNGRRSRHDAKLVVHVVNGTGGESKKTRRAFRLRLSANVRGLIRIQVPKALSQIDSALVLRCVPGGYVRRVVPIRNTGTVPVTMRTKVLSKSNVFTAWPKSFSLLPGEACACTIQFSAVENMGISMFSAKFLVLVPGASYTIPIRGKAERNNW